MNTMLYLSTIARNKTLDLFISLGCCWEVWERFVGHVRGGFCGCVGDIVGRFLRLFRGGCLVGLSDVFGGK